MTGDHQFHSIKQFEAAIFPIWKGIEERDREIESKMKSSDSFDSPILLECLTLHRQDDAIIASKIKPWRDTADQAMVEELRRKSAKSAGQYNT